jgi:HisJ family histidinol phosphate phosphatase
MTTHPLTYDLHVHTEFSPDSTTPLESYAQSAERHSIHVGFCDHFELAFLERQDYLDFERLVHLLEQYDQVHSQYPNTSLSLEIDYYSDLASEVAEFCDTYRKDLDYLIGVVHTVDRHAVTTPEEMERLVSQMSLATIVERYFDEVEGAITSKLFDGLAHIDGVMRYVPIYSKSADLEAYWERRTLQLGHLCQKHGVLVEVNLRGLLHPWKQTHPPEYIIKTLAKDGVQFFVGSDSHSLRDFRESLPLLKHTQSVLKERDCFQLPPFRRHTG